MVTTLFVSLVALIHIYIFILETFLWTKPMGRKAFRLTPEFAEATKTLGANQGLYNGFLAAGLIWGILHPVPGVGHQIEIFFLLCVLIAGVVGAATVSKKIFFIQSLPALVALVCILF